MKHVVYVISHVHKSLAFEWIADDLKKNYKLTFVLLNPSSSPLEDFLKGQQIEVRRIHYSNKRNFPLAWMRTFWFLLLNRPAVVHAHLFDAQLIALSAAWLLRIKKRIYTRHNSNYHHVYEPKGIKYDRLSNALSTHIISISPATDKTLIELEQVKPSRIVKIPHGFLLPLFSDVPPDQINAIRKKWNINGGPVIGVVARHIEWKGIQYIIPAFENFLKHYPEACLVLANANGPYHQTLKKLWASIPSQNVVIIPFEENVAALYHCFDMYVHTPVDDVCEAFGQTYIEALAAGVPSIFTLSGIAPEFIRNERNALVVNYRNTDEIYRALLNLWTDPVLRQHIRASGKESVQGFNIANMMNLLKKLYND